MPERPAPARPARGILVAPFRYANLCGLAEVICGLLPGLTAEARRGFAKALARDIAPRDCFVPAAVAIIRLFAEDLLLLDLAAASLAEDCAFEAFSSSCAICLARLRLPPFFWEGFSPDLAAASLAEDCAFEAF